MVVVSCASCVASEGQGDGACEAWRESDWQALAAHAKRGCTHMPTVTELPGLRQEALARHTAPARARCAASCSTETATAGRRTST